MRQPQTPKTTAMSRRNFLQAAGSTAAGISLSSKGVLASAASTPSTAPQKSLATVRGAFIYPPTASLREVGYYSWPGSSFDAEGHPKTGPATKPLRYLYLWLEEDGQLMVDRERAVEASTRLKL